ncbi:7TM-containing protein possibly involved in signal transduction [Echinicola vietnamensis DSM 17526]|uniref:7TM-containing protein possibly involved in signal transduction n=2 Tax=Echinicola TaxID=390846 RepID=L0G1P1_ECHVK|nr:7TM-containing protein possibly involved in signal transduction [Echinicola vietnamensis DSM 17526]
MIVLFLFSLVSALKAEEHSVIHLQKDVKWIPEIIQNLDYFIDTTNSLGIEQVASLEFQEKFSHITDPHVVYGHLNDFLWIRMTVANQQQNDHYGWYFESWGYDLDEITFFSPQGESGYFPMKAGYDYPFDDRDILHKNFNYFLNIRPGETKTYFIKIRRSYPLTFSFHLRTNDNFISHSLNEYFFLGLYYGILVLILTLHVYLVIKLKENLYLFSSILIVSSIWFSLGRDGLGFQYLWPSVPWINTITNFSSLTELIVIISTLLFSYFFVQKYKKTPILKPLTVAAIAIMMGMFLNQNYGMVMDAIPYMVISFLILLVPFTIGLRSLLSIGRFSLSYTLAYVCLFLIIFHSYTRAFALFNDPILNWYFVHPVIIIEMVLFSLSILNQIKYLQEEYKKANIEKTTALEEKNRVTYEMNNRLHQKVKERTEEIENMATALAQKNVVLQTTNLKLEELNAQISNINRYLKENNDKLRSNVEEITKDMALMRGFDFEDFKKVFPNKEACLKFLSELKWQQKFVCKKCGYNKSNEDNNHGRRCKNCNYYESPTAETLFHKLKFPIEKAFYILYLSNRKDVELTLNELSEILDLRRETCWAFKNKIAQAMEKVGHNKDLSGWETLALVYLE